MQDAEKETEIRKCSCPTKKEEFEYEYEGRKYILCVECAKKPLRRITLIDIIYKLKTELNNNS